MFPLHSSLKRAALWATQALLVTPTAHAAFSVNADGTVTDTTTGLVWDRCVLGSRTSAATPCAASTKATYNWADALAQVSARNTANHLGYSDWRLPNIHELESLVDIGAATAPTINTTAFPNTPLSGDHSDLGGHWTSTTNESNPADAWIVDFSNGSTSADSKSNLNFVRLVRSGQPFSSFDGLLPLVNGGGGSAHAPPHC